MQLNIGTDKQRKTSELSKLTTETIQRKGCPKGSRGFSLVAEKFTWKYVGRWRTRSSIQRCWHFTSKHFRFCVLKATEE